MDDFLTYVANLAHYWGSLPSEEETVYIFGLKNTIYKLIFVTYLVSFKLLTIGKKLENESLKKEGEKTT